MDPSVLPGAKATRAPTHLAPVTAAPRGHRGEDVPAAAAGPRAGGEQGSGMEGMGWECPIPLCLPGLCIYLRVGKHPAYVCRRKRSHHGLFIALPALNMAMHRGHLQPPPQGQKCSAWGGGTRKSSGGDPMGRGVQPRGSRCQPEPARAVGFPCTTSIATQPVSPPKVPEWWLSRLSQNQTLLK